MLNVMSEPPETHEFLQSASTQRLPTSTSTVHCCPTSQTPSSDITLQVQRLSDNEVLPIRTSDQAAGYDLSSAQSVIVPAEGKVLIPTDLAIAVPPDTYGRIAPRSGLAARNHFAVGAGVIDPDYRGNVQVLLFNHSKQDQLLRKGERVAQLILERILTPQVTEMGTLPPTRRNQAAFGSSGLSSETVPHSVSPQERSVDVPRTLAELADVPPECPVTVPRTLTVLANSPQEYPGNVPRMFSAVANPKTHYESEEECEPTPEDRRIFQVEPEAKGQRKKKYTPREDVQALVANMGTFVHVFASLYRFLYTVSLFFTSLLRLPSTPTTPSLIVSISP